MVLLYCAAPFPTEPFPTDQNPSSGSSGLFRHLKADSVLNTMQAGRYFVWRVQGGALDQAWQGAYPGPTTVFLPILY